MSDWLNVGVAGDGLWPAKATEISFEGQRLVLMPATDTTEQSLHIELASISDNDALTLANRFLSMLTWCDGQGLKNLYGSSGSPVPVPVPRSPLHAGASWLFVFGRNLESDPRSRLALALYREGRTIESVPFEFLSYFKILNIFWNDKKQGPKGAQINPLIEGIRETLSAITDEAAVKRIQELRAAGEDPAHYLYSSGRCAIAHAYSSPTVDPDDLSDLRRLSADMWVVRSLAEYQIEHVLGVRRTLF